MKKLRTSSLLGEYLDGEFSWRLKEIADIKGAIKDAEETSKRSLIRAGVPILYAHWEGFIKGASEALLNYIQHQGIAYRRLQSCYIVFGAKKYINDLNASGNPQDTVAAVGFFLNNLDTAAELAISGSIRTESNLSSTVFQRIAMSIGVDTAPYQTRYIFIDKSLLDRRNNIAHGIYLDLKQQDFFNLCEEVIVLLRCYKTDIENIVTTQQYKRP